MKDHFLLRSTTLTNFDLLIVRDFKRFVTRGHGIAKCLATRSYDFPSFQKERIVTAHGKNSVAVGSMLNEGIANRPIVCLIFSTWTIPFATEQPPAEWLDQTP